MLSIIFCVSHNLQPVCIQAGLSLLVCESMLGLKALAPGVEQRKEPSLFSQRVEFHPNPIACGADADGSQPVTFWHPWGGPKIWKPQVESNPSFESSVVPFLVGTEPTGRDFNVRVNLFFVINVGHCTSGM